MQKVLFILLIFIFSQNMVSAQQTQDQITIDEQGIMRWTKDNTEVKGFGINYTVPFAYAYRNGKKMGVDLKAAIDQDVGPRTILEQGDDTQSRCDPADAG